MRSVLHVTLVALAGAAALPARLHAQNPGSTAAPVNAACALLPDDVLDSATGLDYGPGDNTPDEQPNGNSICIWGGLSYVPGAQRPELSLGLTRGVDTPFPERRPASGCTREDLAGVGDKAYVEVCTFDRNSIQGYVKVGRDRLLLDLESERGKPPVSVKPALVKLAKAAVQRLKPA
jgi:hypothetical protein